MGYNWRGIEVVVYSGGKFRRGAKQGPTLYAVVDHEQRYVAELTREDQDWPIEILAGVYMPEHLRKTTARTSVFFNPRWLDKLIYPLEIMLIEDDDAFTAASQAYDLSRA